MRRHRSSRILATIGSVAVIGSVLLAGTSSVLAANTRVVLFGSPPITDPPPDDPANYDLAFTPATSGGVTSVYVLVKNVGSGTLNHVVLQGGSLAPSPVENPGFIPNGSNGTPAICTGTTEDTCYDSLPDGFSYSAAFVVPPAPLGIDCSDADGTPGPTIVNGAGLQCDIGQLPSKASVTFRIGINVPAAAIEYPLWFTLSGNEGTSGSGSNRDAFFALGKVDVKASTPCSASTFFVSGQFSGFGPAGCSGQLTTLTAGGFAQGAFASVKIRASTTAENLYCKTYKCFLQVSDANVEDGVPVPGGLKWTISWLKSSLSGTPTGAIHFRDGFEQDSALVEIIYFKKTPQCGTTGPVIGSPCLVGKPGFVTLPGGTYFQAVFETADNGGNRGF
jgi:hypothetical protein